MLCEEGVNRASYDPGKWPNEYCEYFGKNKKHDLIFPEITSTKFQIIIN